MPTQTEVFEEFVQRQFGTTRYQGDDHLVNDLLGRGRIYANAVHGFPTTKVGKPCTYIDIADMSQLNACACRYENTDIIALFKGSAEVIVSLFKHILAHPHTFNGIGNAQVEEAPEPRLSLRPDTAYMPAPVAGPFDPSRQLVAALLYDFARQFLFAHEIAHVRFGHVHYLNDHVGQNFIEEIIDADAGDEAEEPITRQTFEMNADSFAVAQGLDNLYPQVKTITDRLGSNLSNDLAALFGDGMRVLELWLYAIHAFFRLLACKPFDVNRLAMGSHPPARVRQIWILQTLWTRCQAGLVDISLDDAMRLSFSVATTVENDIATIMNVQPERSGLAIATEPAVDVHLDLLRTRWTELRDRLENLSYGTELAI